ncbi:unnamed protein product [Lymnaea stagnalis]|uniref:Uncharacterized protein n=1 Tax=Lymnaea stagnalis TaxID=6523 RepID=A0AAV2ILF1_LYMST
MSGGRLKTMNERISVERQVTFTTEPAQSGTANGTSIRRGDIEIPVVPSDPRHGQRHVSTGNYSQRSRDSKDKKTLSLQDSVAAPVKTSSLQDSVAAPVKTSVTISLDENDNEIRPPLSLSMRKKLKQKPRIRVPLLNFDASAPTLDEEVTQENFIGRSTPKSIRSDTILFRSSNRRKSVSFNLTTKVLIKEDSVRLGRNDNSKVLRVQNAPNETSANVYKTPSQIPKLIINSAFDTKEKLNTKLSFNGLQNKPIKSHTTKEEVNQFKEKSYVNTNPNGLKTSTDNIRKFVEHENLTKITQKNDKINNNNKASLASLQQNYLICNPRFIGLNPSSANSPKMSDARGIAGSEHETFEEVLQDRNAMAKSEKTYHKRISQLEDELKAMVLQCQSLSEENKELRKTLDGIQKVPPGNDPLSTKQFDSVVLENGKLNSQNEQLGKKINALEKKVDSFRKNESHNHEAEAKNQELQAKIAELQKENLGLKSKIVSLEDKNQIITTTLVEKRKELNEMMRSLKNEATSESKLKASNLNLEEAEREISRVKKELEEVNNLLLESEGKTEKLKAILAQKDKEVVNLREDREQELKLISELKNSLDTSTLQIKKYEDTKQAHKALEKDVAGLRSRVSSLKAEVESSHAEKDKLKQERNDLHQELDRLHEVSASHAATASESKKRLKKWEAEKELRFKAENELTKREEEVRSLKSQLQETQGKMHELYARIQSLEDANRKLRGTDVQDVVNSNNALKEENKKLKQMLVERNIELLNKKSEQEQVQDDTQILFLERKNKISKVRVQQVPSGWVDPNEPRDKKPSVSFADKRVPNNRQTRNLIDRCDDIPAPSANDIKLRPHGTTSPRSKKVNKSSGWDDSIGDSEDNVKARSPGNLPSIETNLGYFTLYREKLKRMKEKRF